MAVLTNQDLMAVLDNVKCIKLFVPNVDKNVKFHSNPQKANQFIVETVSERRKDFNLITPDFKIL